MNLRGKTALITGGTTGIGKEIACKFAKHGANLVITNISGNDEVAEQISKEYGIKCLCICSDVGNFESAKQTIETTIEEFGTLDFLINNAGITKDMLLMRMTEDEFDSVINVNLKGAFNMIRHSSKYFIRQKSGSIVNISSIVGVTGNAGQANYSASKAGLIGLTKSTAREFAIKNITCNAVAPGFISTAMTEKLSDSIKEQIFNTIPLKRFGTTEEVADAVLFLATNPYITGEVLNINGGMYM